MQRCIGLALQGAGSVAPNPMVGAVLVHDGRIIGEGYHKQYGQPHAEVNCINNVLPANRSLIAHSTLYVSLEPCAHFGKTPPCADLIISKNIPRVVIGCRDPFKEVDGKGIEKLRAAGIEVIQPLMEPACKILNERFFTFHTKHRPYIILKWAQTANGFIGNADHSRLPVSNEYSNRLVHKWRGEEAAILVGTHTALYDNPSLTTRLWTGNNPVRLVIDKELRLPASLQVFDDRAPTIVFNYVKQEEAGNLLYYQCSETGSLVQQVCDALYSLKIQSVLVEGGTALLQSFIDENVFDEVRIITNNNLQTDNGLPAPVTAALLLQDSIRLGSDSIRFFKPLP
jgi:diaminohydroxyphosphoribosylaminopyrimidine deaminase/5-amino-6-(5-phosphoribosylamino)uracil reductase